MNRAVACLVCVLLLSLPLSASKGATPFTVVVLPDTQNYTNSADVHQDYGLRQTRWIRDNRVAQNIKFVLHVGDLQNPGNPYFARTDDIYQPDLTRPTGFIDDDTRWRRADAVIDVLDNNNIPYSIVPGNHEYLRHSGQYERQEPIYYLEFFGPQRYAGKPTFGGSSPADPVLPYAGMNTYHTFSGNGYTFLNIALQFDPNDHDLRWAQKVINENPGLPTIVTTHAYLDNNGYQPGYKNIWDDFVRLNPQIVMTVNGHITGEHRLTDTNIAGHSVHQMLVDYQATDFPGLFQGGGYLRTMQFDTDANVVRVKSYSPNADDLAGNDGFLTDGDSQFNLPINFVERFGLPNGAGMMSTISFQQGVAGYSGTRDTYLTQGTPDTNHGEETIAWVDRDRDDNTAGQQQAHALIRFDSIFTAQRIPAGAIINSAELVIHTSDLTDSQSASTMSLHRLLKGWTEPNATWDSQGDGILTDAVDSLLAATDAVVPDVRDGYVTFDVTESLWAWAQGAPNEGWALLPGGTNGWRWDTSEALDPLDRPRLVVTYTVVPEPTALALLTIAAATSLRRRV